MTEDKSGSALGLLCPTCRVSLTMSEREGVEIDFCLQCRGVWLDRGELDKIIERSERSAPAQAGSEPKSRPGSPDRDYGDDRQTGHHGQRRRRGFLSDLFD